MIQKIDFTKNTSLDREHLLNNLPRAGTDITAALKAVIPLIEGVKEEGEAALREQAEKFDGVVGHEIRVSPEDIARAQKEADPLLVEALQEMITRVRAATKLQVPEEARVAVIPGGVVTQRHKPVSRVGLYVPGGKAVYPSSVVMNAVAAQVAGVESIAIASPAQADGRVHKTILTAASLLGIYEVYAIGGAGAIAAFAYGVESLGLRSVDTVTGPGNIFVAAAKRALQGKIGIDSEAGTTEILIIADETANPKFVAADLLSQAEHDEAAASVLVTDSQTVIERVEKELAQQLSITEHVDRASKALNGSQSALILVSDIGAACAVSNAYAPEHLSIQTNDDVNVVEMITDAGAIFIGPFSPVSLGDYLAGSNHVLPTGGTARFSQGLGAHSFLRSQQIITYTQDALLKSRDFINTIATSEQLPAHAEAVNIRFKE